MLLKNQVPTDYFSQRDLMLSIILEILKDEKIVEAKSWFYKQMWQLVQFQKIILNNGPTECRQIGYKFSDRLLVNVYGTRSNIASTAACLRIGLRLNDLFDKPIFRFKINTLPNRCKPKGCLNNSLFFFHPFL
jgi:hypothetical protein